jgi:hypothetical protein
MILRLAFYIVITFASFAIICSQADAQAVAVFDFEFIDTSLEGATNGLRADEQARLARLAISYGSDLQSRVNFRWWTSRQSLVKRERATSKLVSAATPAWLSALEPNSL